MTPLTQKILQIRILRSQFLTLALISLVLIAIQATPASAQWTTNGNNINNTNSGNVGIGTTTPGSKLHVYDASGTRTGVLMLGQNINNTNEGGALLEVNTAGSGTLYIGAYKPGIGYGNTVIQPEGGNVGIGTTAPST